MLIFELLNDHREALREEGKINELLWEAEKLNVIGEVGTAQSSRLQADLDHEACGSFKSRGAGAA